MVLQTLADAACDADDVAVMAALADMPRTMPHAPWLPSDSTATMLLDAAVGVAAAHARHPWLAGFAGHPVQGEGAWAGPAAAAAAWGAIAAAGRAAAEAALPPALRASIRAALHLRAAAIAMHAGVCNARRSNVAVVSNGWIDASMVLLGVLTHGGCSNIVY